MKSRLSSSASKRYGCQQETFYFEQPSFYAMVLIDGHPYMLWLNAPGGWANLHEMLDGHNADLSIDDVADHSESRDWWHATCVYSSRDDDLLQQLDNLEKGGR